MLNVGLVKFRGGASLVAVAAILLSLFYWMFHFYPVLGHDLSFFELAMEELKHAWRDYGAWNIDFSPFRCLGLPVFANPTAILFTVFHLAALFLPALPAIYAVNAFFLILAFFGCLRFVRRFGLSRDWAVLFSLAWCLQGWDFVHAAAGHFNYLQMALFPLFLDVLLDRRAGAISVAAVGFWFAHFFYCCSGYLFIFGIPSLALAAAVLAYLVPETVSRADLGVFARRLSIAVAVGVLAASPKIFGILRFMALFPRIAGLDQVGFWRGLEYSAGNFFFPFPYDVRAMAGWIYGNWESYLFLAPGAAPLALFAIARFHRKLAAARFLGVFAALVLAGALTTSGILAPVLAHIPLLRSLRANPRWTCPILLPYFAWLVALAARLGSQVAPLRLSVQRLLWIGGFVVIFGTPFGFLDRSNLHYNFVSGSGVEPVSFRSDFCYEPVFGDYQEHFPRVASQVDWLHDPLFDPRCYLKDSDCESIPVMSKETADYQAYLSYGLTDPSAVMRVLKLFGLTLYFLLFLTMLWSCARLFVLPSVFSKANSE